MGIYLPNMEMPEDGVYFCEVGVIDGVGTITFHTEERQVFHLVEVPPHGKLIDKDKLLSQFREMSVEDYSLAEYLIEHGVDDVLDDAPTIIEADG